MPNSSRLSTFKLNCIRSVDCYNTDTSLIGLCEWVSEHYGKFRYLFFFLCVFPLSIWRLQEHINIYPSPCELKLSCDVMSRFGSLCFNVFFFSFVFATHSSDYVHKNCLATTRRKPKHLSNIYWVSRDIHGQNHQVTWMRARE